MPVFAYRSSGLLASTIGLFLLLSVITSPALHASKEHLVRPGQSINAAIRAASPGDIIIIDKGDYLENIVIDKALTLRGRDRPTLSGGLRGDVIRVKAPDVTIEGLIIRDSGANLTEQNAGIYAEPGAHRLKVLKNDLAYNLFGIWLESVNDVQIIGNLITGKRDLMSNNRGNGIQLYNTDGARIIGNNISFTRDGIYVDISHHAVFRNNKLHHVRYGTHYMNSYYNLWEGNESYLNRGGLALMVTRNQIVRNNIVWGNTDHGIMLRSIQDSVIENNIVAQNGKGFFVYDAEYNIIRGNLVIRNRIGMHLWAGSYRNGVDGNDFIHNREQVRYVASRDVFWGEKKGNYWSNYTGWDADGNGAGDLAYTANDVVDRLTWRHPYIKILLHSPSIQSLRMVSRQFPVLRVPSIVDRRPGMKPHNKNWSRWFDSSRY